MYLLLFPLLVSLFDYVSLKYTYLYCIVVRFFFILKSPKYSQVMFLQLWYRADEFCSTLRPVPVELASCRTSGETEEE